MTINKIALAERFTHSHTYLDYSIHNHRLKESISEVIKHFSSTEIICIICAMSMCVYICVFVLTTDRG